MGETWRDDDRPELGHHVDRAVDPDAHLTLEDGVHLGRLVVGVAGLRGEVREVRHLRTVADEDRHGPVTDLPEGRVRHALLPLVDRGHDDLQSTAATRLERGMCRNSGEGQNKWNRLQTSSLSAEADLTLCQKSILPQKTGFVNL